MADDSVFERVLTLVQDKQHGRAREMLAFAMGKMNEQQAVDELIKILDVEDVAGHALIALGKLRAQKSRAYVKRFLTHPKTWVRQEAKRALSKIDRTS